MDTELVSGGWNLEVERGPDCLLVKVSRPGPGAADQGEPGSLAEVLSATLGRHLLRRLVLDLGELSTLDAQMAGELARLGKDLRAKGGLLRLCGLAPQAQQVLRRALGEEPCPHFTDRQEAVVGHEMRRPR